MKKILFIIMLAISFTAQAKDVVDAKYLKGAVPEINNIICFKKNFSVPGKSEQEINQTLCRFVKEKLMAPAIQDLRTRMLSEGKEDGTIVAKIEEYMVFKKKPLYLDRTRFRYQVNIQTKGSDVSMEISQISYYYNEEIDGTKGIDYRAEEWISDKEALNKSGKKLYPRSGKFRIKTIDRVEEIFNEAMNVFEAQGHKAVVEK